MSFKRPISFIYVRHGQTQANKRGLMCGGAWDIDLDNDGHAQATTAAKIVHNNGLIVDHMFVSPLVRTRSTAAILNKHYSVPITYIDGLKEWLVGDWDRRPIPEIAEDFDANLDPPNGEPLSAFCQRIGSTVEFICGRCAHPLIVSHGAVWKQICYHLGTPYIEIRNCQVAVVSDNRVSFLEK